MRRALIVTVAATSSLVLLAMLVPLALLIRNYDLEDRLARAALEVQATETVVSRQDRGMVATYVDRINARDSGITTTVLYPDGIGVGPRPGESAAVAEARRSGRARVDDTATGARILVPVSLGAGAGDVPDQTPVVRVDVGADPFPSRVHLAWAVLALVGLAILAGALLLADRLGTSFVRPIRRLADSAGRLGGRDGDQQVEVAGPPEVQELARSLNRLVVRIEGLLEREREDLADLSHRLRTPVTALRLDVDALAPGPHRDRLVEDVERIHAMVDQLILQARRAQRDGLDGPTEAVAVLSDRAEFWRPLAEEQGRSFTLDVPPGLRGEVPLSRDDLEALVDVLLDNVFSHTPSGIAATVRLEARPGGIALVVEDDGDGFPAGTDMTGRGRTGAGSTGLGLAIAEATTSAAAGTLTLERSAMGGALVVAVLPTVAGLSAR